MLQVANRKVREFGNIKRAMFLNAIGHHPILEKPENFSSHFKVFFFFLSFFFFFLSLYFLFL